MKRFFLTKRWRIKMDGQTFEPQCRFWWSPIWYAPDLNGGYPCFETLTEADAYIAEEKTIAAEPIYLDR